MSIRSICFNYILIRLKLLIFRSKAIIHNTRHMQLSLYITSSSIFCVVIMSTYVWSHNDLFYVRNDQFYQLCSLMTIYTQCGISTNLMYHCQRKWSGFYTIILFVSISIFKTTVYSVLILDILYLGYCMTFLLKTFTKISREKK